MKKKTTKKVVGASAPAILSPKQILEHIDSKEVAVFVPEFNAAVQCKIPGADKLFELKMKYPDKQEYMQELFESCLIGFSDKDLAKMKKGNGLKYMCLFNAVVTNADLFLVTLSDENIKK
jgi:hypothetical protein